MKSVVIKFGGSVLQTPDTVTEIAQFIKSKQDAFHISAIVVSAIKNKTNALLEMAHSINASPASRELTNIIGLGEQESAALLAIALEKIGIKAVSVNAWQAGIVTEEQYNNAEILHTCMTNIEKCLEENVIPIIVGFQGVDKNNNLTTLGRNGSDITAIVIANALNTDECHIYSNTDGLYVVDPALSNSMKYDTINYEDFSTIIRNGSQVFDYNGLMYHLNNTCKLFLGSIHNTDGTSVIEKKNNDRQILGINFDDEMLILETNTENSRHFIHNNNWQKGKGFYVIQVNAKKLVIGIKKNLFYDIKHMPQMRQIAYSILHNDVSLIRIVNKNVDNELETLKLQNLFSENNLEILHMLPNQNDIKIFSNQHSLQHLMTRLSEHYELTIRETI